MTRKGLLLLLGSVLATLIVGQPPAESALTRPFFRAALPAVNMGPAAAVADDDESRQPCAGLPALDSGLGRVDRPELASPTEVLAQHQLAHDPIPVGIRKLPAPSGDASPSH